MPGRGTGTQAEVLAWLRDGLERGRFGDRVPSVRELAGRFGCSITPVHRALRQLVAEGRVRLRHGARARVVAGVRPPVTALLDGAGPGLDEPGIRTLENATRDWMLHHLARASTVQVRLQGSGDDEGAFCDAVAQIVREPPAAVVFAYPQRFTPAMRTALDRLHASGIAVVHWAAVTPLPGCDRVESDFAAGSRLLTEACRARGMRRPLRIVCQGEPLFERQKQVGFAAVLGDAAESLTLRLPADATGWAAEQAWLAQHLPAALDRTHADAILAVNDAQVPMFYGLLARLGRRLPVAGYDRTWHEMLRSEPGRAATGAEPASVDRDLPEVGRQLAALAIARATGSLPRGPQRVLVPPRLHLPPGWPG